MDDGKTKQKLDPFTSVEHLNQRNSKTIQIKITVPVKIKL